MRILKNRFEVNSLPHTVPFGDGIAKVARFLQFSQFPLCFLTTEFFSRGGRRGGFEFAALFLTIGFKGVGLKMFRHLGNQETDGIFDFS